MDRNKSWENSKNVLCVRLDNMGDVLMTTPAFRALKSSSRKLTLLTSTSGAAIAPFIPEVDEIMSCDVPWVKNEKSAVNNDLLSLVENIKQKNFDATIIFTTFGQSSLP